MTWVLATQHRCRNAQLNARVATSPTRACSSRCGPARVTSPSLGEPFRQTPFRWIRSVGNRVPSATNGRSGGDVSAYRLPLIVSEPAGIKRVLLHPWRWCAARSMMPARLVQHRHAARRMRPIYNKEREMATFWLIKSIHRISRAILTGRHAA